MDRSGDKFQWFAPNLHGVERESPLQGRLASMPVEVILLIVQELPIEDCLCLLQTCRRLRQVGQDNLDGSGNSQGSGVTSLVTPDASRPYRDFHVTHLLQSEDRWSDRLLNVGSPIYDLADPQNTLARRLARTLQKDQLCRSCWDFRRDARFVTQLRALLRPMNCDGCARPHPSVFFPPSQRLGRQLGYAAPSACVGRLGTVRPCSHVRWTWETFLRMRSDVAASQQAACALCDTFVPPPAPHTKEGKAEAATAAAVTRTGSAALHRRSLTTTHFAAHGTEHILTLCGRYSASAGEEALRQACTHKEGYYPCPHWRLSDRYLLEAVIRAYRDCQRDRDRDLSVKVLMEVDSLRQVRCAICRATFELRRETQRGTTAYGIHVQRIMRWNTQPDLDWLDHLDPRSFEDMWYRSPDTYHITWCHDPMCLTSRGRRKEAVLYSLARWAEDPEPHLWESARRRALFLEWFVTAIGDEDEQFHTRKEETDRLYSLSRGTAAERASAEEEALSYIP